MLEDCASLPYTTVVALQLLMLKRVGDTSLVWYWLATRSLEWVGCECKSTYALLPSTCTLAIKVLATKQSTNAYLVSLVNATRTCMDTELMDTELIAATNTCIVPNLFIISIEVHAKLAVPNQTTSSATNHDKLLKTMLCAGMQHKSY